MVWEKRLIDDSLSASLDEALGAAKKSEEKYLKMLKEQGRSTLINSLYKFTCSI